jgi:hypothetical protein
LQEAVIDPKLKPFNFDRLSAPLAYRNAKPSSLTKKDNKNKEKAGFLCCQEGFLCATPARSCTRNFAHFGK